MNGALSIKIGAHKRRGSVSVHDMNGAVNGLSGGGNQNNDAIIFTMGQLLLELGQMFKVGKVQDLTTILKRQLDELQSNSNHPSMSNRNSNSTLPEISEVDGDLGDEESPPNGKLDKAMMLKMGDRVDTSPTGVDKAWINTQTGKSGHRRRASLPFINANQLEDEEEEDISDIE